MDKNAQQNDAMSADRSTCPVELRAFLRTIAAWDLSQAAAGNLVGVDEPTVRAWQVGQQCNVGEEVAARMLMVAKIRTALDLFWSAPLCNEWISLPNSGEPYCGLSPLVYIEEHGWPGLFWVLCQAQARAVGNV